MMTVDFIDIGSALRRMSWSVRQATQQLVLVAEVIASHREQWLCEGEGQWPDKFTLLNRYVRTDLEPPFIFND